MQVRTQHRVKMKLYDKPDTCSNSWQATLIHWRSFHSLFSFGRQRQGPDSDIPQFMQPVRV